MKNPFSTRQSKVMKQLGLKDTQRVTRLTIKMHKSFCEECKIKLQTGSNEPPCKECLEKNADTIRELKKIRAKLRGY